MILDRLHKKNLFHAPKWVLANTCYLAKMGSQAYAVNTDDSDLDIYGFCIAPKEMTFPHLSGHIPGFGKEPELFEQIQQHHIQDPDKDISYDIVIYNIVKYFNLCMGGNPNMIDSLFCPRNSLIHTTQIGERVRESRHLFLSKQMWPKFKGYAFSELSKIRNKTNAANPRRAETIAKFGYDLKNAYQAVRLLNEIEQIMTEHDLDLQRNREQLKSIRRGEWTFEQFETYFVEKERTLEDLYTRCTLPTFPDESKIKMLLLECLEHHYGDISTAVARNPEIDIVIRDIQTVLDRYKT